MSRPTYCMRCGARLSPDARFCAGCGQPIDDGSARDISDALDRLASEPWGDRSQHDKDAERERLVVNWLRVGIVALYALQLAGDVASRGWAVPKSTDGSVIHWWAFSLSFAGLAIWSAAIGGLGGRRRTAIWQAHTIGMIVVLLIEVIREPEEASILGIPLASMIFGAFVLWGTMSGTRWLGTHVTSLVPSAWLQIDDARGWQIVAWVVWPFVVMTIATLIP